MNYQRLVFVLPCYGLDDFPETMQELEAIDFLGAWTSLWHPSLLLLANSLPEWKRADSHSLDIQDAIIVCPQVAQSKIDPPLIERFALSNCIYIPSQGNRTATLAKIFEVLQANANASDSIKSEDSPQYIESKQDIEGRPPEKDSATSSDDSETPRELTLPQEGSTTPDFQEKFADFFAFGYAYLQIHLLTRKLRYSSTLDQPLLTEQAIEASRELLSGNMDECERWLQSCFDQLAQERDHYYSQSAYLIDLNLLAPTTLGKKLTKQLSEERSQNFLASASLLAQLKKEQASNFESLQVKISEGKAGMAGGLVEELPIPLLTPIDMRRTLREAQDAYRSLGVQPPKVFGRFEPGVTPDLSMALRQSGYQGMLLIDWNGSAYPQGNQAKITWEAADGTGLDSIANFVIDAGSTSSFVALGARFGSQLDHHQVPTVLLAHWPGSASDAMEDLIRCTRRSPALGIWTTLDDYFSTTQRPYHQERLAPQRFANPSAGLPSGMLADLRRYWQSSLSTQSLHSLEVLEEQITAWMRGRKKKVDPTNLTEPETPNTLQKPFERIVHVELEGIEADLLHAWKASTSHDSPSNTDSHRRLLSLISERQKSLLASFAKFLPRKSSAANGSGLLVMNPYAGPRRVYLRSIEGRVVENPDQRVYAAEEINGGNGGGSHVVVDVPPLGVARIEFASGAAPKRKWNKPMCSSEGVLGNEFIEGHFDTASGRMSSLYISKKRGNRLSGMLALRLPKKDSEKTHAYTSFKVERQSVAENNSVFGRLRFEGYFPGSSGPKLVLEYSLWRGSRAIEIEIKTADGTPTSFASGEQLVWRTAWPSEAAMISFWNQGVKQAWNGRRAFSPLLIEIDEAENHCYIATGGIANHERFDYRFLDSLIPCGHGCEGSLANLALAIDLPRPYQFAQEWLDEPMTIADSLGVMQIGCGAWFIQGDAPNIGLHPLESLKNDEGQVVGMRIFLHETQGKSTSSQIEFFRTPHTADRVDSSGKSLGKLEVKGDAVSISVRPHEQSMLDILWSLNS